MTEPWIDLTAMSDEELDAYNRKIRRQASQRARRIDKNLVIGRRHIGKKSRAYKRAVELGLVKPTNREERRKAPKKGKPFSKLSRLEKIKKIREVTAWLNNEYSNVTSLRKLYNEIGKGFGSGSQGEEGVSAYSGYVYDLYRRFCEMYPALNYMISRNPRHRWNSDQWLEDIADIVDSSSTMEDIFDRLTELGEKAYEEIQRENESDDADFFSARSDGYSK